MSFIRDIDFPNTVGTAEDWVSLLQGASNDLRKEHKYICLRTQGGLSKLFLSNVKPTFFQKIFNKNLRNVRLISLQEIMEITDEVSRREPTTFTRTPIKNNFIKILTRKENKLRQARIFRILKIVKRILPSLSSLLEYWLSKEKVHLLQLSELREFAESLVPYQVPAYKEITLPLFPSEIYPQILDGVPALAFHALRLASRDLYRFMENNKSRFVNALSLPVDKIYPHKTSALLRECVISHQLTSIECGNLTGLSKRDLANVCKRLDKTRIKKLAVEMSSLDQDIYTHLQELNYLRIFNFRDFYLYSADFLQLDTLRGLTHLSIEYLSSDYNSFNSLFFDVKPFRFLKSLSIQAPYSLIMDLPSVHRLQLKHLEHFVYVKFSHRKDIFYRECSFNPFLEALKGLKTLKLRSDSFDSATISEIDKLDQLTTLDLSHCKKINNLLVLPLLRMINLRKVILTGTRVSSDCIDQLRAKGMTVIKEPGLYE